MFGKRGIDYVVSGAELKIADKKYFSSLYVVVDLQPAGTDMFGIKEIVKIKLTLKDIVGLDLGGDNMREVSALAESANILNKENEEKALGFFNEVQKRLMHRKVTLVLN